MAKIVRVIKTTALLCLKGNYINYNNTECLKERRWKNIYHVNSNLKKVSVAKCKKSTYQTLSKLKTLIV